MEIIHEKLLPSISEDYRIGLDKEFTYFEIEEEIMRMKFGKSPGLDGFSVEFYRTFRNEIPHLLELFQYCL